MNLDVWFSINHKRINKPFSLFYFSFLKGRTLIWICCLQTAICLYYFLFFFLQEGTEPEKAAGPLPMTGKEVCATIYWERNLGRWQSRKHQESVSPHRQKGSWQNLSDGTIWELWSLWEACCCQGEAWKIHGNQCQFTLALCFPPTLSMPSSGPSHSSGKAERLLKRVFGKVLLQVRFFKLNLFYFWSHVHQNKEDIP